MATTTTTAMTTAMTTTMTMTMTMTKKRKMRGTKSTKSIKVNARAREKGLMMVQSELCEWNYIGPAQ